MAKGQAQAADKQLQTTNQAAQGQGANAQQLFGTLAPNLTNQLNHPGYDNATKSAILGQGMEAANQPFASAMQEAKDTASRTGNSAGLDTSLDSMARAKAAADSNAAQTGQIAIANDAQKQQQQAQTGLGDLFGVSNDTMAKLYGTAPGILQGRAAGGSPFTSILQSAIGAGGTIGAAALKN